jgi:flavin reductase (DIM6/NTAB) family NADH-FMN oxidoreductase RutF/rhodanese-related sulfurtransferase
MGQKEDPVSADQSVQRVVDITDKGGVDALLAQARARLRRLEPWEAAAALDGWAVLVDIRPAAERAAEGDIPGALVLERNVLEWRFDPNHPDRLPMAHHGLLVIVICSQGTTSSLAAAALLDIGVHRATDVIGGFHAWRAAGLPVTGVSSAVSEEEPTELSAAAASFASGIVVVTTLDGNRTPVGVAVRSFMALSADPQLVAVALPRTSRTLSVLLTSGVFAISVLAADQASLARHFASGRPSAERFDGISWRGGEGGIPLLEGALAVLECQLDRENAAGDQVIVLGKVVGARVDPGLGDPLLYHRGALVITR